MFVDNKLRSVLRALGEDADQVAETLRQKGIKGKLEKSDCCPIANYLTSRGFIDSDVDEYDAYGTYDGCRYEISLPMSVSKFVRYFDKGAYHDLQETT